ncbi:MAG: ParB/RepB/Spo0J family partition protein [Ramlibacter sp.]
MAKKPVKTAAPVLDAATINLYLSPELNTVQLVDLSRIVESETQPRKVYKPGPLAELAESIKAAGVMQPILLRPITRQADAEATELMEIVYGHRRFRGAQMAGLAAIPATVRELTNEQAELLQALENLHREDLDPIEEAESYRDHMARQGLTAAQMGECVKKSRTHVYNQLQLLKLCPEGQDLVRARTIGPEIGVQVARLVTHDLQREALEEIVTTRTYGGDEDEPSIEVMSNREVQRLIDTNYSKHLSDAIFDRQDMFLVPDRPDCHSCPQRAGNMPEANAKGPRADLCGNPECFGNKTKAHLAAVAESARAQGGTVIAAEEARPLFPGWSDEAVFAHGANLFMLNKANHELGGRTAAEAIGKKLKDADIVHVVHPRTGVVWDAVTRETLIKHKALSAPAAKSGNDDDDQDESGYIAPTAEEREAQRQAGLLAGRVREQQWQMVTPLLKGVPRKALDMVVIAWRLFNLQQDDTGFSEWLATRNATLAADYENYYYDEMPDRDERAYAWLHELDMDELALVCVELALLYEHDRIPHDDSGIDPLGEVTQAYGLDMDKCTQNAKAALAAETATA